MSASIWSSCAPGRRLRLREQREGGIAPTLLHKAVVVEEVVDELEEETEVGGETAPRLEPVVQACDRQAAADRRLEEPPGLEPVQLDPVGQSAVDVQVLAADHPERRLEDLLAEIGSRVPIGQLERLGQERVAGEDRLRLAEANVNRRAPSALGIVVQRRQVVVDE